jgi:hypothetical protein
MITSQEVTDDKVSMGQCLDPESQNPGTEGYRLATPH